LQFAALSIKEDVEIEMKMLEILIKISSEHHFFKAYLPLIK